MFDPRESFLIKNLLGEGTEEELAKSAIYKLATNTVVEPTELVRALEIVPRTVMSWLRMTVGSMQVSQNAKFQLDFLSPKAVEHTLFITKSAEDVYQGEVVHKGDVVARLVNRPLPSVGLVLMSLFELYDLDKTPAPAEPDMLRQVQDIIDRRLQLQSTVERIVDQKLNEINQTKELVNSLISGSNLEYKGEKSSVLDDYRSHLTVKTPKSRIKQILDSRKNKHPEIIIAKTESHSCPDCGQMIFKNENFTPCICFGDDRNKKIFIAKTEKEVVVKFSSSWEPENIELLLEAIKAKTHPHEEE